MAANLGAACWDRTATEIIGVFEPKSLGWFGQQLTYFRNVLEARARGFAYGTRTDPTAATLGMPHARRAPDDYPPLRVALDRWYPADMPAPVRLWWEPDVVALWHGAQQVMRESIPAEGNVVVLSHDQAAAWKIVLPPCHAMFAVLRGVWPLSPDTSERAIANLGPSYKPVASRADVYRADVLRCTFTSLCEITRPVEAA